MKKAGKNIRKGLHIVLTSIIAALGLTSCGYICKYGAPEPIEPGIQDTLVHCMYGVEYAPYQDVDGDADTNDNPTDNNDK